MTELRLRRFQVGDIVAYTIDPTGVAGTIRAEVLDAKESEGERRYTVTFPDQPEALILAEGQLRLIRSASETDPFARPGSSPLSGSPQQQ